MSRRLRFVVVGGIIAIVVYAGVVALYAVSGTVASIGTPQAHPEPGTVTLVLTPESVDASGQRIAMNLRLDPSAELRSADGLTLKHAINVIVTPSAGSQSIRFAQGAVPSTVPIAVIANGSVENWPLDKYEASSLLVVAYTVDGSKSTLLPSRIEMRGYVPGWNLNPVLNQRPTGGDDALVLNSKRVPTIDLVVTRSGSTIAFGVVLLGLLIVMTCLVLFVAIAAFRGKRRVEPPFMSWMGAMLFATIPLRTFLPGAPPIGSWIDYLIVLWVVVGLIGGLVLYVSAWWRWGVRGNRVG